MKNKAFVYLVISSLRLIHPSLPQPYVFFLKRSLQLISGDADFSFDGDLF